MYRSFASLRMTGIAIPVVILSEAKDLYIPLVGSNERNRL